jgi:release factor glutamine methyltransferase
MTLREALTTAYSQLYHVPGLRPEALAEATYLLLHVLNISHASLLTNYDRVLTSEEVDAYFATITRRLTNEPVQYITGEREFYGLPLRVTPAVLIPRNLTERVAESAIDEFRARDQAGEVLRIVDVGTGSGAIAIAIAFHLPHAQITALDLSAEALEVAAENARINNVHDRIRLLQSDLLAAVADSDEPPFDAVVSNPPYVALAERDELHPQVRDFEPDISLYGGHTGIEIYRRLIPQALAVLKPHGFFAAEFGSDHLAGITSLMSGWEDVRFVDNYKGSPRIVVAHKP